VSDDERVALFMPLWIADYLGDTQDLTCEEHGAYFLLLMALWRRDGKLPADHDRLARIVVLPRARWDAVWRALERFFQVSEGEITQRRLSRELAKAKQRRQEAREHAQRAANQRWRPNGAERDAGALPGQSRSTAGAAPGQCPPTPTPSPSSSAEASPPPKPASKRKRPPDDRSAPALVAFGDAWEGRYGQPYKPTFADRRELGNLLKGLEPDESALLPACFEAYVRDADKWLSETQRHSLAWFCAKGGFNKYRTRAGTEGLSERDLRGETAKREFLAMDLEVTNGRAR
jgi:uncharacterized protein YdaU (DUF1376 family)